MTATRITVDRIIYKVLIEYDSLKRSFELMEGGNEGTAVSGRSIRDILGTVYTYSMTVRADPNYPIDYDNFYYKITEPTDYHNIVLPFGQTVLRFQAKIKDGEDVYKGFYNHYKRWDSLELTFDSMEPQRIYVNEDVTSCDFDVTTPVFSSLPKTFYSRYLSADLEMIENSFTLSNKNAMRNDWTVTCGDGYLTIDGSMISGQSTSISMSLRAPSKIVTLLETRDSSSELVESYDVDVITPTFNSLPKTFYSRYLSADQEMIENSFTLSNKNAMGNDWTVTCGDGYLTIDGSMISGQSTSISMSLRIPSKSILLSSTEDNSIGDEQIASYNFDATTPVFSSLPKTFYSRYLSADLEMIENSFTLSNKNAMGNDWTVTCGDGFLTINGTMTSEQSTSISMSLRKLRAKVLLASAQ